MTLEKRNERVRKSKQLIQIKFLFQILNTLSSICTITGISLIWMKNTVQPNLRSILAIFLDALIGLTFLTLFISRIIYSYNQYKYRINTISLPFLILLSLLLIIISIVIFLKFSIIFLFKFVYNML